MLPNIDIDTRHVVKRVYMVPIFFFFLIWQQSKSAILIYCTYDGEEVIIMSEWLLFNAKISNFSAISWREQVNFQWDDDGVHFVLDQHAWLDFYSASSFKQQSADRHVASLGHIILIPIQPVFALSPYCCVLSGEETNTNFIVSGLTRTELEPTIYRTRREHANNCTTDAV